jgi:hypothetical protein
MENESKKQWAMTTSLVWQNPADTPPPEKTEVLVTDGKELFFGLYYGLLDGAGVFADRFGAARHGCEAWAMPPRPDLEGILHARLCGVAVSLEDVETALVVMTRGGGVVEFGDVMAAWGLTEMEAGTVIDGLVEKGLIEECQGAYRGVGKGH